LTIPAPFGRRCRFVLFLPFGRRGGDSFLLFGVGCLLLGLSLQFCEAILGVEALRVPVPADLGASPTFFRRSIEIVVPQADNETPRVPDALLFECFAQRIAADGSAACGE
jgi:hypothetical protein